MNKYAVYEVDHTKVPGKIHPRLVKLSILQGIDKDDAIHKMSIKTGIPSTNMWAVLCPKRVANG